MEKKKQIFILSDATGLTAEMTVNATLSQFENVKVELNRFTMVSDKAKLMEIICLAKEADGIIVYTLVTSAMRDILRVEAAKQGVKAVDLMGPMLDLFEGFLESKPVENPGIQRELSESYFKGIEAMEYTVNHDDGQDPDGLRLADVIIVGVSRTSKTPLCMFLSTSYSLKVANVPIIMDIKPPRQLFKVDKNKVIGLTVSADRLLEIRKARLERASFIAPPKYIDFDRIVKELDYSNHLFAVNGWPIINVTEKSVEETASEILRLMRYTHPQI